MQANEAPSNASSKVRQSHGQTFAKVKDGRKQDIRGLWKRGERFYARFTVENPVTGTKKTTWVSLVDKDSNPVQTVPQAVAELERLRTHRSDNTLRNIGRTAKFGDYAKSYLESIAAGKGAKAPATVEKEKTILGRWTEFLGELRLDQIKRVHVSRFIDARNSEVDSDGDPKVTNRTINLDVIGLRCVMKKAMEGGLIQRLPMEGMKPLPEEEVERTLFTSADLDKLCEAASQTKAGKDGGVVPLTENAEEFIEYIRLMAFSGARRNEALGLKWDDVDFAKGLLYLRRQVTRRGIETLKNGEERYVNFNAQLKGHLEGMATRGKPAGSAWLFPSPQRGEKDIPAKTFRESLEMVRTKAGMPHFCFHDLRHHFISMCVMSGIDYMTIAAWAGHKDGGVLIGKVYGHINNTHRELMAQKLCFQPSVVQEAAAS